MPEVTLAPAPRYGAPVSIHLRVPTMTAYCEVALPVPLDRTFTYAVPRGQHPQRGARVIAPFRNEKLIGVVTALSATAPAGF